VVQITVLFALKTVLEPNGLHTIWIISTLFYVVLCAGQHHLYLWQCYRNAIWDTYNNYYKPIRLYGFSLMPL